jgi:hypothetical protein
LSINHKSALLYLTLFAAGHSLFFSGCSHKVYSGGIGGNRSDEDVEYFDDGQVIEPQDRELSPNRKAHDGDSRINNRMTGENP